MKLIKGVAMNKTKPFIVRGGILHICTTFGGKRIRFSTKLKDTAQNRAFIIKELESLLRHYKAQKEAEGSGTLGFFANKFLSEAKTLKKSSFLSYQASISTLRHYVDFKKPIALFGREEVERFYTKLNAKGLSVSYATRLKMVLNAILELAKNDGILPKNPMYKKRLANLKPKKECEPFSLDEIKSILSACNDFAKNDNRFFWFKNACLLAFFSGLRSGELLALRWENIDFLTNKIYVKSTINKTGLTTPKTKSSLREIDLLPIVAKELSEYKRARFGSGEAKGFLFTDSKNKPFLHTAGEFGELWRVAIKTAGLSLRRFYNTRHSFASVMISNGENIMWVSKMLGHKNANITLNTYARFIDDGSVRASFLQDFSA